MTIHAPNVTVKIEPKKRKFDLEVSFQDTPIETMRRPKMTVTDSAEAESTLIDAVDENDDGLLTQLLVLEPSKEGRHDASPQEEGDILVCHH